MFCFMKSITMHDKQRLFSQFLVALATVFLCFSTTTNAQPKEDDSTEPNSHTVLITGANRGIGLELARQYAAAGWRVIGTARKPESAEELGATGADVMQLDVTDQASVDRLSQHLTGQPIDMLINNAGIQPLMWKLAEVDFDEFEKALSVNAVGPVRVTRALVPNLRSGKVRKVINITTNLSSIAENTEGGFYGYRESKAALNMFNKSLAMEFGPEGFICIVLNPGWVRTDLGGPKAPLSVEESVSGMRNVIENLSPEDNGSFWTHDGKQMPW
jgi:NAD(P)-dependent dehydrogenase (short-subunit alcohol dehydrogenase family)